MTIGKTVALTGWTFVDKVVSLLFNMVSRLVVTFLPRSKRLLISWLQSPSAVILEPPKIKSVSVSTVSPSICHEMMGLDAMILVFWMLSFKPLILWHCFSMGLEWKLTFSSPMATAELHKLFLCLENSYLSSLTNFYPVLLYVAAFKANPVECWPPGNPFWCLN